MSSRKAVTVWSKSDFYFQALHCRDIKGCQFFPDPKKTMTAFTFLQNHNLLVPVFHVFLFNLECLLNPHCILNKAPILDVYFKITSAEARSDGSRSEADASRSSSFPSSLKPESRCRHCKSNQGERKKGFSRRKRYVGQAKNTIRERLARPWQGKSS